MQTFNSFNELAAGQTTLHSDMSVFNAASPEQMKSLASVIADARMSIRRAYEETDFEGYKGVLDDVVNAINMLHIVGVKVNGAARQIEAPTANSADTTDSKSDLDGITECTVE